MVCCISLSTFVVSMISSETIRYFTVPVNFVCVNKALWVGLTFCLAIVASSQFYNSRARPIINICALFLIDVGEECVSSSVNILAKKNSEYSHSSFNLFGTGTGGQRIVCSVDCSKIFSR